MYIIADALHHLLRGHTRRNRTAALLLVLLLLLQQLSLNALLASLLAYHVRGVFVVQFVPAGRVRIGWPFAAGGAVVVVAPVGQIGAGGVQHVARCRLQAREILRHGADIGAQQHLRLLDDLGRHILRGWTSARGY